jgi:hypothetical protein
MKLTRTFKSSLWAWSSGSGVSKASGGRTSPHFASASGSETGANSEMCAGTRRSFFSIWASGRRCGTEVVGGRAADHAKTLPTAIDDMINDMIVILDMAIEALRVAIVLGQRQSIGFVQAIRVPISGRQ